MSKKGLLSFDAFSKTVEDARIRTTSGGIVTIVSVVLIVWLTLSEWLDYRRISYNPELVVDKARGERLDINLDITFPDMPCQLLSMDILDASGEIQEMVEHGLVKTRLDENGKAISSTQINFEREQSQVAAKPEGYCGSCYGAEESEDQCCNSCEEIRKAYAKKGWAFHDGGHMDQCEEEHYNLNIENNKQEGCNIAGHVSVNKVVGNFHFAPGSSITANGQHTHDLSLYYKETMPFTFSHQIHHLSFGPDLQQVSDSYAAELANPLDNTKKKTVKKAFTYQYFIKVVATRYERLNGEASETNQYSVTSHERGLEGGRDQDHPHTLHARSGVPGVFFAYDISPMKVINRELRERTFGTFLTGVCAIVGGVLTVGAVVDRGVWEADKALRRKKEK